ncbi:MAG: ATP-dependent helicase [Bacteroidales bacterium]|nr:ATP-dependent helicase [Bacteroidales bacterium]
MQQKELVIGIVDHHLFGHIMVPYIVVIKPNHGFFHVEVKISQLNISKYLVGFSEDEKQLINWIDEYSDQNLHKIFSKKRGQTTVDFIAKLNKEYTVEHIRPYIEKRLVKCTDLLQKMDIDLYFKEKPKYINSDDKIEVIKGKTLSVFNISKLENESQYYLTIRNGNKELNLLEKSSFILTENPCRIIIENKLHIFDDINAKKLLPFFNKQCIHIPKSSEKKWFETFALESIKQYKVKAIGFEINKIITNKKAELSFENNLMGEPTLVLSFFYNERIKFYANKGSKSSVRFEDENGVYTFHKIERDFIWEDSIIEKLISINLENKHESHFQPKDFENIDIEEKIYEIIKWLSLNKEKINSFGIELIQKQKEIRYSLSEPSIQSNVKEDNDWFDIRINIQIGEFSIPFTKFRKNILNGVREYKLPNGEIAILPEEWFEQYKELFQFGRDADKNIQLDKHHFGLIETSVPDKSKSIIEKYKNLINSQDQKQYDLPEGLKADLRPYQSEGFAWMQALQENHFGGCLADDMGLGKTVQTLTLLLNAKGKGNGENYQIEEKPALAQLDIFDSINAKNTPSSATSIIVMPTSLIHNWEKEIRKFTPDLKCFKFIGQNRPKDIRLFKDFDIILTTYGIIRNELELLKTYKFFYLILDESQYIKNPDSKIYKAINQINSKHRLVLTGTPIENSLTDLWSQINFLNKGLLGNLRFFKREFVQAIEKNTDPEKKIKLQQFIQPFVLRRTKNQVAKDLPDKIESVIYCDMSEDQKSLYEEEKSKIRNSIMERIEKTTDKPTILAIEGLNKLRQIANHPVLIDESYTSESGKYEEITRNIENLIAEKHKVLIFSAYVKHLNLFSKYLEENNHLYSMLTGKTQNRNQVIDDFQSSDDKHVFLIQIKAGGVGLNLTAADYVFIIDPWWNPAVEEQAINRTHRIGQDKKVMVYRFISTDTVEEKIQQLKAKKSELADSFINTEQTSNKMNLKNILEFLK